MLDILRDYITEKATPEMLALLEMSFATFERIELQDYERQYEEILMTAEDEAFAEQDPLTRIINLTLELQNKILRDHAIVLTDEASLEFHDQVISALLDLQQREMTDELLTTLSMDGSPEELFAELLGLFLPLVPDEILLNLQSVDAFAITRIRAYIERAMGSVEEVIQDNAPYIEALRKLEFAGVKPTKLLFVQNVMPLGIPFAHYIDWIGHGLEQLSIEKAAHELLGMALASSDGVNNPRGVIKAHIDRYVSNIDSITKIDIVIGDLLLKINQL